MSLIGNGFGFGGDGVVGDGPVVGFGGVVLGCVDFAEVDEVGEVFVFLLFEVFVVGGAVLGALGGCGCGATWG